VQQTAIRKLLFQAGIVSEAALQQASAAQKRNKTNVILELGRLGLVDERRLTEFLSERFSLDWIELRDDDVEEAAVNLVPLHLLQKGLFIPYRCVDATLFIAMCDPADTSTIDEVRFVSGCNVRVVLVTPSCIEQILSHRFGTLSYNAVLEKLSDDDDDSAINGRGGPGQELGDPSLEAPAVALVNALLKDAILRRASDIHVEPYEHHIRVRFRIDGVLYDIMHPPLSLKFALVARIKIMAGLDVTERRLPQDGRLQFKSDGREVDVRASVIPALFGEKVVLRLLNRSNLIPQLTDLGLSTDALHRFQQAIRRTFGLVLVTGPTGSGKSTTLYSILRELNQDQVNISTAEDPVEYNLSGVNQVQIHPDVGVSFGACLRAFLRQDPDILMVGEIRDSETAAIAIRAALTGHLVLSTLHTNDAPSAVHRLIDMGVEPYLVASSINIIAAQRLLRRICDHCRVEDMLDPESAAHLSLSTGAGHVVAFRGAGCTECNQTGYRGRVPIFEVLTVFEGLKQAILQGRDPEDVRRLALASGMRTLRQEALVKVREGVTSVAETMHMTSEHVVVM
jgi:type IV pilus assembly protein PilB